MSHTNLDNQQSDDAPVEDFEDDAVSAAIGEHQPASTTEA